MNNNNVILKGNKYLFLLSFLLFLNLIFTQIGIKLGFFFNIIFIISCTIASLFYLLINKKDLYINISYFLLCIVYGLFLIGSYFQSISIQDSVAYTLKVLCAFLCSLFISNLIFVNKNNEAFNYRIQVIFKSFFYIFIIVTILGYFFFDEYISIMSNFFPSSYIEKIEAYQRNGRFGGLGIATGTNCYVIIFLSYLGNVYSNKNRIITYSNVVLIFTSILISGARSPIIIWLLSLVMYLIINNKMMPYFYKKNIWKTMFKSLALILVLLFTFSNNDGDSDGNSFRSLDFSAGESVYQRFDLYRYAIKQFTDSNGLGIGIANIPNMAAKDNGVGRLGEVTNTHDIYLQTLAEMGIGGAISLLLFVVYTFVLDIKIIRNFKENVWLKGIATTSLVFWSYGFISNPLYDFQVLFMFFISKSILLGYISKYK